MLHIASNGLKNRRCGMLSGVSTSPTNRHVARPGRYIDLSPLMPGYYSFPQHVYSQITRELDPQSDEEENAGEIKVKVEPKEETPPQKCPNTGVRLYYVRSAHCHVPTEHHCTLHNCLRQVMLHECRCDDDHRLPLAKILSNDETCRMARDKRPPSNMSSTLSDNPYCPKDFYYRFHTLFEGVPTVGPNHVDMYCPTELGESTPSDYDNNGTDTFLQDLRFPDGSPFRACDLNESCTLQIPNCHLWPYQPAVHSIGHMQLIESRLGRIWQEQLAKHERILHEHRAEYESKTQARHAARKKRNRSNPLGITHKVIQYKQPSVAAFKVNPARFVRVRLHNTDDARESYEEDFTRFCITSGDDILERKVVKFVHLTTEAPPRKRMSRLQADLTKAANMTRGDGTPINSLHVCTSCPYTVLVYSDHNPEDFRSF
jgi:hypothetical protein